MFTVLYLDNSPKRFEKFSNELKEFDNINLFEYTNITREQFQERSYDILLIHGSNPEIAVLVEFWWPKHQSNAQLVIFSGAHTFIETISEKRTHIPDHELINFIETLVEPL